MLFDDDEQLEVRHVVSLAHHDISIYSGGDITPEGELFIKRNALCLSRKNDGAELAPDSQLTKPFYLFSENCSAKEDFYFALLRNREQTLTSEHDDGPVPMQFEVKNIISLVQRLHSSEEHLQTRWLNAMIGRVFLGVQKTKDLENFIVEKITKKISRVKRPSFLSGIKITKINTGESAPYFTNPRLKDLTVEGECGIEADVRYTGNFRLEVAATARIDLGSRFKVREVNLVLAVVIKKVEGHVLFKIKPPPSNRVWFSFQQMPKMEMSIEPIVSSRQITYTVILRQIESRIKEVIAESVVLPFWDDVPFFRTEHKRWRGGIFVGDDNVESSHNLETAAAQLGDLDEVDKLEDAALHDTSELPVVEKSHSLPIIENTPPTGLFGRKLTRKGVGSPKASASSTSIDIPDGANSGSSPLMPRSGSSASTSIPTVGTDITNAEFKPSSSPTDRSPAASAIAALTARSQGDSPANTPIASPSRQSILSKASSHSSASSSREATDSEKDKDKDHTPKAQARQQRASSLEDTTPADDASSAISMPLSTKGSIKSQAGSLTRGLFMRRENTGGSASSNATTESDPQQQKRKALTAVTNAAASAKRWGLSALQRHGDGNNGRGSAGGSGSPRADSSESHSHVDLSQPMGRGQPLPPPGVPLPMPDRRAKAAPIPAPKRKPVPPPPLPERKKPVEGPEHSNGNGNGGRVERRPVPPPPLPKRRLAVETGQLDGEEEGENMLVVAAPEEEEDEEPVTPSDEESPTRHGHVQPWVEDTEGDSMEAHHKQAEHGLKHDEPEEGWPQTEHGDQIPEHQENTQSSHEEETQPGHAVQAQPRAEKEWLREQEQESRSAVAPTSDKPSDKEHPALHVSGHEGWPGTEPESVQQHYETGEEEDDLSAWMEEDLAGPAEGHLGGSVDKHPAGPTEPALPAKPTNPGGPAAMIAHEGVVQ